jgi:hypothetical protein
LGDFVLGRTWKNNDVYHWKYVGQAGRLESLSLPFFINRLGNLSRMCRSLAYGRVWPS